jgi:hypothetical protein
MKVMLNVFAFVFICCGIVNAQPIFPESWVGKYQGDLMIYGVDSVRMKVDMKLEISKTAKDSIYDWTLTYDMNGKKDVRAYSLKVVDHQKGYYQIDERNSIILDGYLHNNNVFTSFFKVSNSYIIATYTKKEDLLFFEIIAGDGEAVTISGNTNQGEEEIPEVSSYLVNGRQKAVLQKVE